MYIYIYVQYWDETDTCVLKVMANLKYPEKSQMLSWVG